MQSCSFLTLLVEQTKLDNRTLQDCGVCLEAACAKQVLFSLCARLRDDSQDYRLADQSALPVAR